MIDSPPLALVALLLTGRLALALVFAVAGITKLRDPLGTRTMLHEFGVNVRAAGLLARALPLVELTVALSLVPSSLARSAGSAALALLCAFTAAIAATLAAGRKPDCRCFGQVAAAPIGPATLARNLVLLALAGAVVLAGTESAEPLLFAWLGGHLVWVLVGALLAALLVTQTFLLVQILAQQGRMLLRLESLEGTALAARFDSHGAAPHVPGGLPMGAPATPFTLRALDGAMMDLAGYLERELPVALFFAHPSCGPCAALLPQIAAWQRELESQLTVVIISEGDLDRNRAVFGEHALRNVLVQSDTRLSDVYHAWGTPSALIIAPDGTIASGVAAGADAIGALIAGATATDAVPARR